MSCNSILLTHEVPRHSKRFAPNCLLSTKSPSVVLSIKYRVIVLLCSVLLPRHVLYSKCRRGQFCIHMSRFAWNATVKCYKRFMKQGTVLFQGFVLFFNTGVIPTNFQWRWRWSGWANRVQTSQTKTENIQWLRKGETFFRNASKIRKSTAVYPVAEWPLLLLYRDIFRPLRVRVGALWYRPKTEPWVGRENTERRHARTHARTTHTHTHTDCGGFYFDFPWLAPQRRSEPTTWLKSLSLGPHVCAHTRRRPPSCRGAKDGRNVASRREREAVTRGDHANGAWSNLVTQITGKAARQWTR